MDFAHAHWVWGNRSPFADRPFPVEAIIPSLFITRRIERTVSRDTPVHAVSIPEIEKGARRASTASRTNTGLVTLFTDDRTQSRVVVRAGIEPATSAL